LNAFPAAGETVGIVGIEGHLTAERDTWRTLLLQPRLGDRELSAVVADSIRIHNTAAVMFPMTLTEDSRHSRSL
jgi:hypothetical protein